MIVSKSTNIPVLEVFEIQKNTQGGLQAISVGVKAGFPSPADDFVFETIDFNIELFQDPDTTFLAQLNGDSMQDMRNYDGDLMLVYRSLEPQDVRVAVCYIEGEFTL